MEDPPEWEWNALRTECGDLVLWLRDTQRDLVCRYTVDYTAIRFASFDFVEAVKDRMRREMKGSVINVQ